MPAQKITKEIRAQRMLKGAIAEMGMTQTTLSKRLGIDHTTLSQWIKNPYRLRYKDLSDIGRILHIDIFGMMQEFEKKEEKA